VLTHSGGSLELEEIGSLKLNARNSRGTVKKVAGALALDAIGGDLAMNEITGPLEIEGRNTDLKIDDIKDLKAPLRINSTGGEIIVRGLRTEARLDGRNSIIELALAAPAPVTIYNLGEIRATAPPGGGESAEGAFRKNPRAGRQITQRASVVPQRLTVNRRPPEFGGADSENGWDWYHIRAVKNRSRKNCPDSAPSPLRSAPCTAMEIAPPDSLTTRPTVKRRRIPSTVGRTNR